MIDRIDRKKRKIQIKYKLQDNMKVAPSTLKLLLDPLRKNKQKLKSYM